MKGICVLKALNNLVRPYLPALLIIALVGLYVGHRAIVRHEVSQAVQVAETKMESKYQGLLLQANVKAKRTEDDLKNKAERNQADTDAKLKSVSNQLSAALVRLQQRTKRPTTTDGSPPPDTGKACTGRELYREDGEFLIREAAQADQVVIERDHYYKAYEDARKTLDNYEATK